MKTKLHTHRITTTTTTEEHDDEIDVDADSVMVGVGDNVSDEQAVAKLREIADSIERKAFDQQSNADQIVNAQGKPPQEGERAYYNHQSPNPNQCNASPPERMDGMVCLACGSTNIHVGEPFQLCGDCGSNQVTEQGQTCCPNEPQEYKQGFELVFTTPRVMFDLTIGELDRVLSKVVGYGKCCHTLDEHDRQTLKHHADDMRLASAHIQAALDRYNSDADNQ